MVWCFPSLMLVARMFSGDLTDRITTLDLKHIKKIGIKMIISVASGKGGTGKTTIATNLALSITNVELLDCDAEEPNCYLFLNVDLKKVEDVYVSVPVTGILLPLFI